MPAQIAALASGRPLPCEVQNFEANILKLTCAGSFPLRTPVKVENSANLWMGEIWACEPEAAGFLIEIEVSQVLRDPRSVEIMAGRFRQAPKAEHLS